MKKLFGDAVLYHEIKNPHKPLANTSYAAQSHDRNTQANEYE